MPPHYLIAFGLQFSIWFLVVLTVTKEWRHFLLYYLKIMFRKPLRKFRVKAEISSRCLSRSKTSNTIEMGVDNRPDFATRTKFCNVQMLSSCETSSQTSNFTSKKRVRLKMYGSNALNIDMLAFNCERCNWKTYSSCHISYFDHWKVISPQQVRFLFHFSEVYMSQGCKLQKKF